MKAPSLGRDLKPIPHVTLVVEIPLQPHRCLVTRLPPTYQITSTHLGISFGIVYSIKRYSNDIQKKSMLAKFLTKKNRRGKTLYSSIRNIVYSYLQCSRFEEWTLEMICITDFFVIRCRYLKRERSFCQRPFTERVHSSH